ncbi:thymidylate kinase [Hyphomonas neptunium ATCC 15444]|uniref:Thymidylate kinase n=2 Tax=Hyphomonas TaxID=85 RepID=Q0C176_HYPNA|nr:MULTISPECIES: dTMP kinase [Hyphomonas]ABI77617.1 thymidylate kinase [Hyphomonas neptunium ATCC 15444]KCZ95070.1 thymidylate kinase [Hyphomonas hirschiana VP5]
MTDTAAGHFITLEGGEGTGKSTLAKALARKLEAHGIGVVVTREPGGTPLAEAARQLLLHPPEGEAWSPLSEALLVNAARRDHLEKLIRPALARGDWVICDRFADSTRVYQSIEGGVDVSALLSIEREVLGDTVPSMTLILDVSLDVASKRRTARAGALDTFERRPKAFHEAVRAAFQDIARSEPARCRLIDTDVTPDQVLDAAWKQVATLLQNARTAAP